MNRPYVMTDVVNACDAVLLAYRPGHDRRRGGRGRGAAGPGPHFRRHALQIPASMDQVLLQREDAAKDITDPLFGLWVRHRSGLVWRIRRNSMASITMKDICVSYNKGKTFALKNLSLQVKDGEFCVFLGPSGCGKSTAMHCIAGLLKPESGEVYINKEMVTGPARSCPRRSATSPWCFRSTPSIPT